MEHPVAADVQAQHSPAVLSNRLRLRWLAAAEFHVDVDVSEFLVVRERIFPSLDYEIVHRLALPAAGSG